MGELPIRHVEFLHARLDAWAMLWDVPLLAKSIGLRTSTRLRRALGTYSPARSQITLARWLLDDVPHPLLGEVLCHEAAHAAVHLTRSRRQMSMGPSWDSAWLARAATASGFVMSASIAITRRPKRAERSATATLASS